MKNLFAFPSHPLKPDQFISQFKFKKEPIFSSVTFSLVRLPLSDWIKFYEWEPKKNI